MTHYSNWPGHDPARAGQQPYGAPPPPPAGPYGPAPGAGQQNWGYPPVNYGPGHPAPPYTSAGPGGAPPPKSRKPLLITVGAAVAVLAVVGVIVAVLLGSRGDHKTTTASGSASDVAKAYLEALARGDAKAALDLGAAQPGSSDLLTGDVLKQQIKMLPISNIEILGETPDPRDSGKATVKVAARLGDKRTETKISVVNSDGRWKLESAFVNVGTQGGRPIDTGAVGKDLTLQPMSPDSTLLIFGKPIDKSGHFYAFPGALQVKSSSPYIDVNQPPPLTFDQLSGVFDAFVEFKYSMNDAGRKASEDALRAFITKCYSPGPKTGSCVLVTDFGPDYDPTTISLTGPIDMSGLKYTYLGTDTWVMVSGTVKDMPFTVRTSDGQTRPKTTNLALANAVDISKDPAAVVQKK